MRLCDSFGTLPSMKKRTQSVIKAGITLICLGILYVVGTSSPEEPHEVSMAPAHEEVQEIQKVPKPPESIALGDIDAPLELPALDKDDPVYYYHGFTLLYDEEHEQARWVAYELTSQEVYSNVAKREDNFRIDPKVSTGSAEKDDYYKSGYDRGHLAPAGDLGWSEESMSDSFYFTNMSPQDPSFNRGIWRELEELMRDWAVESGSVLITTGPILEDGLSTIGANQVSIPRAYYKVVIDYTEPTLRGIGFILPNEKSSQPLSSFALPIDEVERVTGIDFFANLPDNLEEQLESTYTQALWNF